MINVQSNGNNVHEAKIKALDLGRRIALKLFSNHNGILLNNKEINSIPYLELKECFFAESVKKEESLTHFYRAEVNYQNSKAQTLDLLSRYIPRLKKFAPTQIYLFPVLKRNQKYCQTDTKWHNSWRALTDKLKQQKIEILKPNAPITNILLLGKKYNEIAKTLPNNFYKTIIIAIGEFSSFSGSEKSVFSVQYKVLTRAFEATYLEQFPLNSQCDNQNEVMQKAAEGFMTLSRLIKIQASQRPYLKPIKKESRIIKVAVHKHEVLSLNSTVARIKRFGYLTEQTFETDRQMFSLKTMQDDYSLAEALYLQGLGYEKNGDTYTVRQINRH